MLAALTRPHLLLACLAATTLALGAASRPSSPVPVRVIATNRPVATLETTASGLAFEELRLGSGPTPARGQICVAHYTGWLWVNGVKAAKFDSSFDRGQPIEFQLGMGHMIKGWEEGLASMKVGGKRRLVIPPDLGYGAHGAGHVIPPNATLMFEVELLQIR